MGCWSGYLSGTRCRLFAYGPADATVVPKPHHLLPHLNPDWFYVCGTGLPWLSWKEAVKRGVVVVVFMISVCTAAPATVAGSRLSLSLTLRQRESPHHMLVDRRWFRLCVVCFVPTASSAPLALLSDKLTQWLLLSHHQPP